MASGRSFGSAEHGGPDSIERVCQGSWQRQAN
jgi:hypothetical protein